MTLLPQDIASAFYDRQTKTYTVTDSTGRTFQMSEEAFDTFIAKMETTISDLGVFRDKLMGGTVVSVRENWNHDYLSMAAFQDVDAVNLQLGSFDDAVELQEAYRTVYYPTRAEQLDRVYHGLGTSRVVSEEIKVSYMENDGAVTADLETVQNEFASNNGITESEVEDVRSENDGGQNGEGTEGESEEDAPPML